MGQQSLRTEWWVFLVGGWLTRADSNGRARRQVWIIKENRGCIRALYPSSVSRWRRLSWGIVISTRSTSRFATSYDDLPAWHLIRQRCSRSIQYWGEITRLGGVAIVNVLLFPIRNRVPSVSESEPVDSALYCIGLFTNFSDVVFQRNGYGMNRIARDMSESFTLFRHVCWLCQILSSGPSNQADWK